MLDFSAGSPMWDQLFYQGSFVIRIMVAGVLGFVIGYERQNRYKGVGMRTHAIVAMASALLVIISKYGFDDVASYDAARVAAQIVSGIGFLGAGVIFVRNNAVSGLTTAAGLWATAGVGMAIGAGLYVVGISAGILLLFLQIVLHRNGFLSREPYRSSLKFTAIDYKAVLQDLQEKLATEKIKILNVKITKSQEVAKVELDLLYPPGYEVQALVMKLVEDERIGSITG